MSRFYLLEKGDVLHYPEMNLTQKEDDGYNLSVIDRRVKRYSSGKYYISYLYDNLLDVLVREMHDNINNKLDNLIVVHGHEGVGKSHLAYALAKKFNPDFDLKRNYIYQYDEFLTRIIEDMKSPPGTVYWLDEASNIASNRDWMHTDNKEFIKVLEMFRSRGWTLILCVPKLDRLDLYIRETRARYILKAAEMSWDLNSDRQTPKRGYFLLTRVNFDNAYRSEKDIGFGRFPPITGHDLDVYEDLKLRSQTMKLTELEEVKEASKNGSKKVQDLGRKNRALILELHNLGYSNDRIGQVVGQSGEVIAHYLVKARKEVEE